MSVCGMEHAVVVVVVYACAGDVYCMCAVSWLYSYTWSRQRGVGPGAGAALVSERPRGKGQRDGGSNASGNLFVDECERKKRMVSLRSEDGGGGSGNRIFSLHGTAPSAGLRRVRVLVLADGAPHRRNL